MKQESLLGSFILRVIVRTHKPVYHLQNIRTGEQQEFNSIDAIKHFLRTQQPTGLDPPKSPPDTHE